MDAQTRRAFEDLNDRLGRIEDLLAKLLTAPVVTVNNHIDMPKPPPQSVLAGWRTLDGASIDRNPA